MLDSSFMGTRPLLLPSGHDSRGSTCSPVHPTAHPQPSSLMRGDAHHPLLRAWRIPQALPLRGQILACPCSLWPCRCMQLGAEEGRGRKQFCTACHRALSRMPASCDQARAAGKATTMPPGTKLNPLTALKQRLAGEQRTGGLDERHGPGLVG